MSAAEEAQVLETETIPAQQAAVDTAKTEDMASDAQIQFNKEQEGQLHLEYAKRNAGLAQSENAKMKQHPNKPIHEFKNDTVVVSSVLMIAAVMGSYKMKLGAEGAMAALTGTINGIMEGDEVAYKRHMDAYNMNLQKIADDNAAIAREFKAKMADEKLDYAQKLAEIQVQGVAFGIEKKSTLKAYEQEYKALEKMNDKLQNYKLRKPSSSGTTPAKIIDLDRWKSTHSSERPAGTTDAQWDTIARNAIANKKPDIMGQMIEKAQKDQAALKANLEAEHKGKAVESKDGSYWLFPDGTKFDKKGNKIEENIATSFFKTLTGKK